MATRSPRQTHRNEDVECCQVPNEGSMSTSECWSGLNFHLNHDLRQQTFLLLGLALITLHVYALGKHIWQHNINVYYYTHYIPNKE